LKIQAKEGLEGRLKAAGKLYAERETYFERPWISSRRDRAGMGFPGYFPDRVRLIKWAKEQDNSGGAGPGSGCWLAW